MSLGRSHRPVVDPGACQVCGACARGCPAEVLPELRGEQDTLRGALYTKTPLAATERLPPCRAACPLGQDVRGYVGHLARGRWKEALLTIRRDNALPSVCGTLCHHPCQGECLRGAVDSPVAIRRLKLLAVRYEREHGQDVVAALAARKAPANGLRVAVVGSGPAGLAAAYDLVLGGCRVEVLEGGDEPGGLLSQAIPDFRFPREVLAHELSFLARLGISVETRSRVADPAALAALLARHDAVILAFGAGSGVPLGIPGWEGEGCLDALSYLRGVRRGQAPSLEGPVVVVGGGNVALDAARAARRAGAARVTVAYRRGRSEMPAAPEEVAEAEAEGIRFIFRVLPAVVERSEEGPAVLRCVETGPGVADADGRAGVVVTDRQVLFEARWVLAGVGQTPEHPCLPAEALHGDGRLRLDGSGQVAGRRGLFGAGDAVSGPSYVVAAMASGRAAARGVLAHLGEAP
ncbi:MAG: FAD-dependent oxidoreductase [Deferrisomatales bacterium]|nr:FAD-dependent oxidoreductase [Deferrisomatales bacterium]